MSAPTRYDIVPYPSKAYAYAHPDRLFVVGRLFGMKPVPPARARVLELGCGAGGHLVPMARQLPEGEFVGLDLAQTAIRDARALAAAEGLTNVRFDVADILDLPDDLGTFDYIVAHGVFSWIPEPARVALMGAIPKLLNPQGVAYVSYNTYPGWHLHNAVRDVMRVHAEAFTDPTEQVEQAKAFVKFVHGFVQPDNAWAAALGRAVKMIDNFTDGYFFHDFLAPVNDPMLFRDFVARAERVGLQYLGDAVFGEMLPTRLPDEVRGTLQRVAKDIVSMEQYMDLVRGTAFRRSLLVHAPITLDRDINASRLSGLVVSLRGQAKADEVDLTTDVPVDWETYDDTEISVSARIAKAALVELQAHHPEEIPFEALVTRARRWLGTDYDATIEDDTATLGGVLIHAFAAGLVELSPRIHPHAVTLDARPLADHFARGQAASGAKAITNTRHEQVGVGRFDTELLRLCDGTRDHDAILEGLIEAVAADRLSVKLDGKDTTDPDDIREALTAAVVPQLRRLLKAGVLVPNQDEADEADKADDANDAGGADAPGPDAG